jgi:hypothetical protein
MGGLCLLYFFTILEGVVNRHPIPHRTEYPGPAVYVRMVGRVENQDTKPDERKPERGWDLAGAWFLRTGTVNQSPQARIKAPGPIAVVPLGLGGETLPG